MTPRRWYILAASVAAVILTAVGIAYVFRNSEVLATKIRSGNKRVRGMARSTWGRVENSANKAKEDLIHTEREPGEDPTTVDTFGNMPTSKSPQSNE